MNDDELEREFADVLGVLRRFEPAPASRGFAGRVEEKVAMALKQVKVVEAATPVEAREVTGISLRCTYCHAPLARDDAAFCAACLAPHHEDCWVEHGRCTAPGCAETRVVRPREGAQRPTGKYRATRRWARLLVVTAGLAGVMGTALFVRSRELARQEVAAARDERAMLEEFRRLKAEGLKAFGEFNRSEKPRSPEADRALHDEAYTKLVRAMDLLTKILDRHRDPATGFTPKDHEPYEAEQSEIAEILVDLEKRHPSSDVRSGVVDVADLVAEAKERIRQGRLDVALARIERAVAAEPANAAALLVRAEIRIELGELEGAVADLTRAIALRPTADAYRLRGRVTLGQGQLDVALQDLLHATELEPGAPEAIADFERALEIDPASDIAWYGRARVHLQRGEVVAALADIDRAIELDPSVAAYFELRARIRERLGDLAGAKADEARAAALRGGGRRER